MKDITPEIKLFQFAYPQFLWILAVIPIFFTIFFISVLLKKRTLKRFGDSEIIAQLMPEASPARNFIKFVLMNLAFAAIVLGAARPQFGVKMKEVDKRGAELVIALDVSNSMMAEDIQPNRLERAKEAISQLMETDDGDNMALIVFAGEAYTQIPMTSDFSAAELFLSSVKTDMVPVQGTDISSAIDLGMKSFSPQNDKGRAIIIITDGEDHEEDAIAKAKEANAKGIIVCTLGMGDQRAVPIPDPATGDFRKDAHGKRVLTELDETLLKQIARAGGGVYTRANNTRVGLKNLFADLQKLDKSETKSNVAEYDDRYSYFVILAIFFLLVEFFILERQNRWLNQIKIFE
jgi:Ca-activated chloride channel family protein